MHNQTIPLGLCQCGCGAATNIAPQTNHRLGYVKGQPVRYRVGHHRRKADRWELRDCGHATPCRIWLLSLTDTGYGWDHIDGVKMPSHRAAWLRERGPVPEGLELDHLCRIRACVNVDHLEPVTHTENMRRGRQAKLTPALAAEIRRRSAAGESLRRLALAYGVSTRTIGFVRDGKTWQVAA